MICSCVEWVSTGISSSTRWREPITTLTRRSISCCRELDLPCVSRATYPNPKILHEPSSVHEQYRARSKIEDRIIVVFDFCKGVAVRRSCSRLLGNGAQAAETLREVRAAGTSKEWKVRHGYRSTREASPGRCAKAFDLMKGVRAEHTVPLKRDSARVPGCALDLVRRMEPTFETVTPSEEGGYRTDSPR